MATVAIQGVVTTGIYCRADCAAQPHARNVRPYPSMVAASAAGFRPCLKCRPDRLIDNAAEVPPAVAQALVLITEGALDEGTEADVAARVGYSGRQLRRLFLDHVGATPDYVARSRRAHFARRLFDETDLTITDIAYAAGFSSARQMNRDVKAMFGFTPTELRRRRRRTDLLATDGGLRLRVAYRGSIDVAEVLAYLGSRAIPGVETVVDGRYRRTIESCGYPGVIEVADHGDGRHLEVTAHLPTMASVIDDVARVRQLFGCDHDQLPAYRHLSADPVIGALVRRRPGLRLPGAWDRFETSVRVLLGQQVSVAGASTIAGRIAAAYGTEVPGLRDGLSHVFPTAEQLADADLEGFGMPKSRGATIVGFARAVASGELDLYAGDDLDAITVALTALPGIGPWSAAVIAGRVMRHPDAFAASDLGLRKAVGRLLAADEPPSAAEVLDHAEAWRPHRTTAAAHLWFSAADAPVEPSRQSPIRSSPPSRRQKA